MCHPNLPPLDLSYLQIDPVGKMHELFSHFLDLEIVQRGRAHDHLQPLAVVRNAGYFSMQTRNLFLMTLADQAINFVEHKKPDMLERQMLMADQVFEAAGRSHDNVHTVLKRRDLLLNRTSTYNE